MRIFKTTHTISKNVRSGFRVIKTAQTEDVPSKEETISILSELADNSSAKNGNAAKPNHKYFKALLELLSNAEIDNVDTSSPSEMKGFGDRWSEDIRAGGLKAPKDPSDTKSKDNDRYQIDMVKMVLATKLKNEQSISFITNLIKDRLGKIAQIIQSSQQLQTFATGVIDDKYANSILQELAEIQKIIFSQHLSSKPQIEKHIVAGINAGKLEAEKSKGTRPLDVDGDTVASQMIHFVPSEYAELLRSKGLAAPDATTLFSFGQNIFIVSFIALNNEAFAGDKNSSDLFLKYRANLTNQKPFGSDWRKVLTKEYRSKVEAFKANLDQEDDTSNAAEAERLIDLKFIKISETFDIKHLTPEQAQLWRRDVKLVAKQYASHSVSKKDPTLWPNENDVSSVALAVCALLSKASEDKKDAKQQSEIYNAIEKLKAVWDDWYAVFSRIRTEHNGPISVIMNMAVPENTTRFSRHHYEKIFSLAYGKLQTLIVNAVKKVTGEMCQAPQQSSTTKPNSKDKTESICANYKAFLDLLQGDGFGLAKPKAVVECFSSVKQILTSGDFNKINRVIQDYSSNEDGDIVNDQKLSSITDLMLMQIKNWGEYQEEMSADDSEWREYDAKDQWQDEKNPDVSKHFEKFYQGGDSWAKPHVIIFGSALLWLLYGKAKGIR